MFKFRKRKKIRKARILDKENDHGNIEYKLKLCNFKHDNKINKLSTQMKFRLYEGEGYAIYNIGYTNDGSPDGITYELMMESLNNIYIIAQNISAILKSIKIFQGINGYCSNIFIEKYIDKSMMYHQDITQNIESIDLTNQISINKNDSNKKNNDSNEIICLF